MLFEVRSLATRHPLYWEIGVVTAVFQIAVDFSQTNPVMRQQGQTDLALVSTEVSRSRQEVYGFRCLIGLEQGLGEWAESLERRQSEMRAWRLMLLEGWIPKRVTGLVRCQERMSLVQAGALKETMYSFGQTLSQTIGRHRGMSLSILQR